VLAAHRGFVACVGERESTGGGVGEVEGCSERRQIAGLACTGSKEREEGVVSMRVAMGEK
jgi:hypothetical protein